MKSKAKKVGIAFLIIIVAIQFIRPSKNMHEVDASKQIASVAIVPENVNVILKKACNNCHSNNTIYPWYSNIQPVYFWLDNHINEGKKHLNFDEFATYRLRKQYHKMEEVVEMVQEGFMPLKSYVLIHDEADLTKEERVTLTNWAQAVMDTMKARYPIDSLIKKKS